MWKWPKSATMSYFMQFWPILRPYDPLKSPVHYQGSTLKGSYFPKSLHKLVLPENGSISIFFEEKVLLKDSKVEVRGAKSSKFQPKKAYKIRKSASNITIFGQKLCFGLSLLELYFKFPCILLSLIFYSFSVKKWAFFSFFHVFCPFSPR